MIDLLYAATELVTRTRHGSPAMLQRCLKNDHGVRITYKTALSLLDQMHDAGIVGPGQTSMGRQVLMESDDAVHALRSIHGASWSDAA
ncbi:DNA translocase FtsK [Streptomyces sp. NBC_00338]|uniref:DNA translocase FtsK n=1 Tax=Streptomyces sp. NBC_00338 TaxID=2975715 RepID=UPI002252BF41|nr:DNA translocase FtsK [Streptomyces sp. NBC_00338]MCX5145110.1 hypothetical protein [Streptomyces sp. NBC_00338]